MSISSGYDKFKDYHQTDDGSYKLTSRWTSSNTVELDDGSTAEEKITEINSKLNNITDSILDTMEEIEANTQKNQLAGASAVKEMSQVRLSGLTFVKLTQTEYDALTTKDANTIYFTT